MSARRGVVAAFELSELSIVAIILPAFMSNTCKFAYSRTGTYGAGSDGASVATVGPVFRTR